MCVKFLADVLSESRITRIKQEPYVLCLNHRGHRKRGMCFFASLSSFCIIILLVGATSWSRP